MNETSSGRKLLHTRHIDCHAYERSDGLYDIEGEVRDITPDGTDLFFKMLPAGSLIHRMHITMTVNQDLVIQAVTTRIDESPTHYCPGAESAYASLVGLQIGPGIRQQVRARVGGANGCTHLTELILGPMATTAMQARFAVQRASPAWRGRLDGDAPIPRPVMVDTCYTYRLDGEAVKQLWPEHRRGTDSPPPTR